MTKSIKYLFLSIIDLHVFCFLFDYDLILEYCLTEIYSLIIGFWAIWDPVFVRMNLFFDLTQSCESYMETHSLKQAMFHGKVHNFVVEIKFILFDLLVNFGLILFCLTIMSLRSLPVS